MKNLLLACALSVASLVANAESFATGNLNYSISKANDEVVLTLINKTPDVPVTLESVGLLFPSDGDRVHLMRNVDRSLGARTEISLGKADAIAKLVDPTVDLASWNTAASDLLPPCHASECESKKFAVMIVLNYPNTVSQQVLGGFMQYSR